MEENKNQQLVPLQMTKPVIQALVMKELTALRYKQILDEASSLSFTKDNLAPDYPALKELDRLLKLLDELRKRVQNPYYVVCQETNEVFKELTAPLKAILEQKKAELKVANDLAEADKRQALAEQQRKENILLTLAKFINQTTLSVSAASTDDEITRIQKLIGTEKAKKSFYAEYYDELCQKCSELDQPIKERKAFLREKMRIEEEMKSADDIMAVELKAEQEILELKTQESAILLQEAAFSAASTIQTVVGEPIIETVKPKMKRWAWRIDDMKLLHKKMPHLVKLVPDEDAIKQLLATKKAEEALKDGEEINIFGLVFYQEKYY